MGTRATLAVLALAAVPLAVSACGGGSGTAVTVTVAETVTVPADTGGTETILDNEPATTTAAAETDSGGIPTCEEAGIGAGGATGTCEQDGVTWHIVNRDEQVETSELAFRLLSVKLQPQLDGGELGTLKAGADAQFAIFTIEVTNLMTSPQSVWNGQFQVLLDGNLYTEDFEAENGYSDASFVWQGKEIQPQGSLRGTVVYRLPKSVIPELRNGPTGNLDGLMFTQESADAEPSEVGVIRLYQ